MNSLLARLLLSSLAAVVIGGVLGGYWMYRNLLSEADEFFDNQLTQTALALRHQAFERAVIPPLDERQAGYDFVVQVWSLNGVRVYQSQPHVALPGITQIGLSTVDTAQGRWRVFGVPARGFLIQVSQPMAVREGQAARLALHTLLPFVLLVPLLGVLITVAVTLSVRKLSVVAERVRNRPATGFDPIPEAPLPDEIRPLAAAFNELLSRLAVTREREQAFLSDAAHELRTPLTALRLQLDALLRAPDEGERRRAGELLSAGLVRASRLVEQLLTLSRQELARPVASTRVALDSVAKDVIEELLPLADARDIDLGLTESHAVSVEGDADALRALLRNLVDNALRYTPRGGNVDVSVLQEAAGASLRVCDSGPGIPAHERERVFERFYRMPGTDEIGSGLGLAIVKRIADAHGAHVTIGDGPAGRPQSGAGACVTVRFSHHASKALTLP